MNSLIRQTCLSLSSGVHSPDYFPVQGPVLEVSILTRLCVATLHFIYVLSCKHTHTNVAGFLLE